MAAAMSPVTLHALQRTHLLADDQQCRARSFSARQIGLIDRHNETD